jgi:YtkA-like protein
MTTNRRLDACLSLVLAGVVAAACGQTNGGAKLTELQRARSGMLDVVLLSPRDGLHHGQDSFVIEFRSTAGGTLVDVGTVKATATMTMPGMPMLGTIDVKRTNVPGRYEANSDFSMAGTWRTTVEWNGPAGQGSVTVAESVQ